jgi:hypothetical protein
MVHILARQSIPNLRVLQHELLYGFLLWVLFSLYCIFKKTKGEYVILLGLLLCLHFYLLKLYVRK